MRTFVFDSPFIIISISTTTNNINKPFETMLILLSGNHSIGHRERRSLANELLFISLSVPFDASHLQTKSNLFWNGKVKFIDESAQLSIEDISMRFSHRGEKNKS